MAVQVSELDLDCRKCTEADKINHGCDKAPSDPCKWSFEGVFLERCPMRLVKKESWLMLKYYGFYKQGYLFNEGTIAHQPDVMLKAFNVIEKALYEIEKEKEGQK